MTVTPIAVARVEAIFRYPVKSMAGEPLDAADVGWHGIEGDRRFALRRVDVRTGFPWLTASRMPALVGFAPFNEAGVRDGAPTHVRTPDGRPMEIFGDALAAEVERHHGAPVRMMHLRAGIFDEASVSVITTGTVQEIGRVAGRDLDVRRFRPNIVVSMLQPLPFGEDAWVGGTLSFGEPGDGPRVGVTMRDERCSMVNLDPDSGRAAPEILKAIVGANRNNAGIYATVVRTGRMAVGQAVSFEAASR